jgi:hypothetical protein
MQKGKTKSSNSGIINALAGQYFDLWRRLFQIHNPKRTKRMPTDKLALALEQGLQRYIETEIILTDYTSL